jgi:uncharacterized protein YbjT (DUF2867 family)
MSRIVVIGGNGRTGRLIVEQLIAAGHSVVATIRNPRHMAAMVKLGAETVILHLDKSSGPDFQAQFKGADAIIFAAGSATGESSALDRTGTIKTARAAESAGVKRYLTISSIGASTGMKLAGEWNTEEMRDYYKQKRAANKYLRETSLDWTILEPGGLTDGKGTGKVTLSEAAIAEGSIDRADVAAVLIALLATNKSIGHAYQLIGGKTAIDVAVGTVVGDGPAKIIPFEKPAAPAARKAPAKKAAAKKVPAKKAPAKK